MVSSVSRALGAVATVLIGTGLTGCVTTQEKNARTVLLNARTLASESSLRLTSENPAVRIISIEFVPGAGRARGAVVVTARSTATHPLSDLPISVGVKGRGGQRTYLNVRANLDYYDTHLPGIPAGATFSWVLPGVARGEVAGRKLFAIVGLPGTPASTSARALPRIAAISDGHPVAHRLAVAIRNDSDVPQYGLQVYAIARRGGRVIGAGRRAIGELDGEARTQVSLPLIGTAAGATVDLYSAPTIFK